MDNVILFLGLTLAVMARKSIFSIVSDWFAARHQRDLRDADDADDSDDESDADSVGTGKKAEPGEQPADESAGESADESANESEGESEGGSEGESADVSADVPVQRPVTPGPPEAPEDVVEEETIDEEAPRAPAGVLGIFSSSMPSFYEMLGLVTRPDTLPSVATVAQEPVAEPVVVAGPAPEEQLRGLAESPFLLVSDNE
jgi:hypothetical protein